MVLGRPGNVWHSGVSETLWRLSCGSDMYLGSRTEPDPTPSQGRSEYPGYV